MADMTKLLPCPFCGGEPLPNCFEPHKHSIADMPDYPGAWSLECVTCEYRIFDHDSEGNARKKWNRRALTDPALAELDAKATQGEWFLYEDDSRFIGAEKAAFMEKSTYGEYKSQNLLHAYPTPGFQTEADAALIVALVNAYRRAK